MNWYVFCLKLFVNNLNINKFLGFILLIILYFLKSVILFNFNILFFLDIIGKYEFFVLLLSWFKNIKKFVFGCVLLFIFCFSKDDR